MNNKSLEECLWSAAPYAMTLVSLAGFLLVLMDPFCWFSLEECNLFAYGNAWKSYDGQGAGLQFFGTVFLAAATLFSWPALRAQIACHSGERVVGWLKFCFNLGYPVLLLGIGVDMRSENLMLTDNLIIGFVLLIVSLGWLFILFAAWTIIRVAFFLCKILFSLLRSALVSLCDSVGRLVCKKRP